MPRRLSSRHCAAAALLAGMAVLHVAHADPPTRAVLAPAPALQVSYESFGPPDAAPPGRFDGALDTPAGTVRTTVHAEPNGEQPFRRGDTTFELPVPVLAGRVELRERVDGGTAAAWRAQLAAGLGAEAQGEKTPVRTAQALHLRQDFDGRHVLQAHVASSQTAATQGLRWDLALTRDTGLARWTAGLDAAERSFVSSSGGLEARAGLRLGTQWLVARNARLEARYTRQVRWDAQEPHSSVMLGSRFDLPRRLSLVTGVEVDTDDNRKVSTTLSVPLEVR